MTTPTHHSGISQMELTRQMIEAAADRFWSKAGRSADGCWPWLGEVTSSGYGWIVFKRGGKRRKIGAHRMAYLLKRGEIASNQSVLHTCGNRSCVNPNHLALACRSNLTEEKVRQVIAEMTSSNPASSREIAARLGVSHNTINMIRKGRIWSEIKRPDNLRCAEKLRGSAVKNAKLTEGDIRRIWQLKAEGLSQWAIACKFGVTQGIISGILLGKSWTHVDPGPAGREIQKRMKERIK
jgi:DNA-binding CsgD family transcriptional regulator